MKQHGGGRPLEHGQWLVGLCKACGGGFGGSRYSEGRLLHRARITFVIISDLFLEGTPRQRFFPSATATGSFLFLVGFFFIEECYQTLGERGKKKLDNPFVRS